MLVPLSWLRDFAPFDLDPVALAEVFDDLGMVVEGITHIGGGLDHVVVARVVSVEAIPDADRIRKVMVDAGDDELVQIVCGAWNFGERDLVPLARVGAVLGGDLHIARRTMRGVVSDGMLCSARELGLGEDAAGLLVLPPGPAPGRPIREALGIEPDVVYDLAIEANRPDANCVAGVARDAAARLGIPFAAATPTSVPSGAATKFEVEVEAPELCDRFTVSVFSGVEVGPSSGWVARRLTMAGMRPISNVVDASNYVMLELGQPTHAYDLDRLGRATLRVRAAHVGERLTTLDDVERVLGEGASLDCVICDGRERAIGIAGIMGGASSGVHDATSQVALEAAHFVPMAIARTSKRLGMRSEASARFERGVDYEGIERSVARFAEVLSETCPDLALRPIARPLNVDDEAGGAPADPGLSVDWRAPGSDERPIVALRPKRVNAVLGTDLTSDEISRLLVPIGFEVSAGAPGVLAVTPPSFRPDATTEIDLIEEVARHHGYVNIPRTSVHPTQVGALTSFQRARRLAREVLAGAGLSEAMTSPLVGPGDHARAGLAEDGINAVDPLAREESVLRASLLPGLLKAAGYNAARRNPDLGLFEIGHVWRRPVPVAQKRRGMATGEQDRGGLAPGEQDRGGMAPAGELSAHEPSALRALRSPGELSGERELGAPEAGEPLEARELWGERGLPEEREVLACLVAGEGPVGLGAGAAAAVVALRRLATAFGVEELQLEAGPRPGLHPTRCSQVLVVRRPVGWVGEVDPDVALAWGIDGRVGWLQVDLALLAAGRRATDLARPVSRFPSSDIDLAFLVDDRDPAGSVQSTLRREAGALLERIALFDVYRGPGVPAGSRSLAFRLRFSSNDRTLTDAEVGELRAACIDAVQTRHQAVLRG